MRVVEFIGVPGSGKTTIAAQVLSACGRVVDIHSAVRMALAVNGDDPLVRLSARIGWKLWPAVYARSHDRFSALSRFASVRPLVAETVLAAQREKTERGCAREGNIDYLFNLFARYQLMTESKLQHDVVLDEGFAQRGVMVFAHGFDAPDIPLLQAYLDAIPLPDLLIHVETPLEVCLRRVVARRWDRGVLGVESNSNQRQEFLSNAAVLVESIVKHCARTTRVVSVSGTSDPSSQVRFIGRHLGACA